MLQKIVNTDRVKTTLIFFCEMSQAHV